jgi:arsenical resistance operon trans-acting repressor ArsD
MNALEVFDPPMCCATGVCGPNLDPRLPQFAADLEWLSQRGIPVTRYNLAHEPAVFAATAAVRDLLVRWGSSCLPLLMYNQRIVARGRYPSRTQLAALVGVEGDT